MSERLLFELKAVDNASGPLRQVQNQLQRTAGIAGSVTKDFRKFALGGLQQAGFQVGDFAVQLANGTNQMQAMGQQLPQLLQIFGPIGSLVGAAVAVFAAVSVVIEKTNNALKTENLKAYADAIEGLKESIRSTQFAFDKMKFGGDDPAIIAAKSALAEANIQVALARQNQRKIGSVVMPTNAQRAALQEAVIKFTNISALLREAEANQAALNRATTAQNGLLAVQMAYYTNIGNIERSRLKVASDIEAQMLAIQMANYTAMGNAERERIATGNAIHKQMIAIQNANAEHIKSQKISIGLLIQQYSLYGQIAVGAKAIAEASQNTKYYKLGTLNQGMMGRAGAKGQGEAVNYSFVEPNKAAGGSKDDPMKTLRDQLELEVRLIGKSEAQRRVIQALGEDWKKYSSEAISGLVDQINSMDELNRVAEMQKQIADSIKSSMEDAFMGIVDGTSSVKDAFRSMAADIIKELYRVLVVQQMVGQLGTATQAGTGLLGGIGRLFGMRAMGGPVTGGKPYMVGERGPEMIVPSRNGNVIANNQLGGGGVTVNQTINITTGVQQTVRAEIRSLMPQIADSAKRAVLDAKQRGGTYGSAF
jgi:hypothetical protein